MISSHMNRREFLARGSAILAGLAVMNTTAKAATMSGKDSYPPETTGVVLVDPLNDFISEGGKIWERIKPVATEVNLVPNLRKLVEGARAKGVKIVYAPHHRTRPSDFKAWKFLHPVHMAVAKYQVFAEGTWGAEFHPDLAPKEGDIVVAEHWLSSAFANTDLDLQLRKHGIDYVVLAGLASNTCVESTGRYAVEMGYHLTFLKDAVATFSREEQKAAVELDYPRIAHAVRTVDEFLNLIA